MKKPNLYLQNNLFWEEEDNPEYLDIIKKSFDVQVLTPEFYTTDFRNFNPRFFRGSLGYARRLKRNYEFTNCLSWIPEFREFILDPNSWFTDMGYLAKRNHPNYFFARPVDGFKTFAGQVFNQEQFKTEYNFLKQNKNIPDSLICMVSAPKAIGNEWRTVFINNQYVDGCQYLPTVEKNIPDKVRDFAIMLSKNPFFLNKFDFVIDICEHYDDIYLLEINSFECSSFYAMDLDKIYSTWANSITNT